MNLDPTFGLPCPDGTDQASLALYMQRLAEAVEARLLIERTAIRSAARAQCAVWRESSTVGPISNSGFANLSLDSSELVFANYGVQFQQFVGAPVFPPSIGQGNICWNEPGEWVVGVAVRYSETGAVSFGTERKMQAAVYKDTPQGGQLIVARMDRSLVTADTVANQWTCWQGVFTIGDDTQNWHWAGTFTHSNSSSTVQINPGDLIVWTYKVSSSDQIEVV